jgi:hypothetical protein
MPLQVPVRQIDVQQAKDEVSEPTGMHIFQFAKQILFCLFVLVLVVFVGSASLSAFFPDNERLAKTVADILEATKIAIPSFATLVIGFYFGNREKANKEG